MFVIYYYYYYYYYLTWIHEKGCLLTYYLFILSWSEMECQKTLMKGLCLVTLHINVLRSAYFVN